MANIKRLQMWKNICKDSHISINTSWFGLRTTTVYTPTQSIVSIKQLEYSPADGEKLKTIFTGHREAMAEAISHTDLHPTVNGNYMLEVCVSQDGRFAALQLLQFISLVYTPVTDAVVFEGDAAQGFTNLFT